MDNKYYLSTAEKTVSTLKEKGKTLSCAESCTGGLVAAAVTDVSGSSAVFEGGVVSYSNDVKMNVLGVSNETLEAFGAVSENTAGEMAQGVRRITGSDISVSTTGIAGPTGGSAEKPVGTVCFGVTDGNVTHTYTVHFGEKLSRDEIRARAVKFALEKAAEAAAGEV